MSTVRTREPVREQVTMVFQLPDEAIPAEHPARVLWKLVERMDLGAFLADARAVEGTAGRDVLSVKMLLTLWLYAIAVNIGSAREIARRTKTDPAFMWIVGDQRVGKSTLCAFRVGQGVALDKLMTDVLAALMHKGLLSLDVVAQDGTRVRANASAPSFRREASLEECREWAALHLKAVLAEGESSARAQAAARDFQRRVDEALAEVNEMSKRGTGGDTPRASTTDPEARVMKMPDGGFRPAYNVQFATAGNAMGGPRTIVGVRVTNLGSDYGSVEPMLREIERRTGRLPGALLADANHADIASIKAAHERGVRPLIAVPKRSARNGPNADKSDALQSWRRDMTTPEAKQILRARASLCELSNAHAKTRFAMSEVLVRSTAKVTCVALMTATVANLLAHAAALLA